MQLVAVALLVAFLASVASAESMLEAFEEFRDKKANEHKLPDSAKGVVCERSGSKPKSLFCFNKFGVRCSQEFFDELDTCPSKRVDSCSGYAVDTWRKKPTRRLVEDLAAEDDEFMPPLGFIDGPDNRRLLSRRRARLSFAEDEEDVWNAPVVSMMPHYSWPSRRRLILRRLFQRLTPLHRRLKKKKKKKKWTPPYIPNGRPGEHTPPRHSNPSPKKAPKAPKRYKSFQDIVGYKNKKEKKKAKKKYQKKMVEYNRKHEESKDGRVWCSSSRGKNYYTHTLFGPCETKGDIAKDQCPQPCGCVLNGEPKRETKSYMRTIRIEGHCGSAGVVDTMEDVLDSWDVPRSSISMFEQAALFDQAQFSVFDLFIQPKKNEARYGLAVGAARCHNRHVEIGYMYTGMWVVETLNDYKCQHQAGCSKVGIPTESIEKARTVLEHYAWKNLRVDKGFGGTPKTIKARGDSWFEEKDNYGWDDLADTPDGWGEDSWGN